MNETATFNILLSRRQSVEDALLKINKRAARKGLPQFAWSWGSAFVSREQPALSREEQEYIRENPFRTPGEERTVEVNRIPLTVPSQNPHFDGWKFIASLVHENGITLINTLPNESCPSEFRERCVCDHCKTSRKRNQTFVLRHEDGRLMQVGSTCIADFLGSTSAADIASSATLLAELCSAAEDGCEGEGFGRGSGSREEMLLDFVAMCAFLVRTKGWVSRSAVYEGATTARATADLASTFMHDVQARTLNEAEPTPQDHLEASTAIAWALTISDETATENNYLGNLRAIATSGYVTTKSEGIAASLVTAHQRHLGNLRKIAERAEREANRAPSNYLGAIKERKTFSNVLLDFVTGYDTRYGYTTILKFIDDVGNVLVWKASSTELERSDVGKRFNVTGTVKAHEEYKGQKQTILSRCKIHESVDAMKEAS